MNGLSNDAIRLRLFPLSLKERQSLGFLTPTNSFATWEASFKLFLCKYFPPRKMYKLWNDITSFFQTKGVSLYEVGERFKELQRECHLIMEWLFVLHNGLQ